MEPVVGETESADLSGKWIDVVHARRPTNVVVLGHGHKCQPVPRRAGGYRLQRPFRL